MKFTKPLLVSLLLFASASALAAQADRPCREDVGKFCSDVAGERRAIGQCIREHLDELSEQCRVAVNKRMEERRAGGGGRRNPPSESEGSAQNQ